VPTGSYPFGAAIAPGGRIGLVTNEASGTLSMIDLERAEKIADVRVGAPLSHPQGVVVDATGRRAYVAVSGSDDVTVVDLRQRKVLRVISVGRFAKLGTQPVALALGPGGRRLFVAESGGDEISVVRLPGKHRSRRDWKVTGRIPVASQPQAVAAVGPRGRRPAQLVWVSAKGEGIGPNPRGTNPTSTDPVDPIFWAFVSKAPNYDIFKNPAVTYLGTRVNGKAGFLRLPSTRLIRALTPAATRQLHPVGATRAPAKTPLRAHGPIKHVFFIVRENRSYDQLLGDVGRGNSDPKLTVFGRSVTPNMHSLVTRFPLLDHVYANSEASIEGHFWTSAATVPDYVNRNWIQNYAGRGRPSDFGQYAVTFPGNGFLFDQAQRQRISYFNYGEAFAGDEPSIPDRDRSEAQLAESTQVAAHSDLGPPFGGCYPSDIGIGNALDGNETFDSSLPAGAPAHSYSHVDCFRARFAQQLAAHAVPSFSYLSLTSDHTRGTQPGFPTPSAMVADSDLAVGQIVDTISHSSIWKSSAIFVVEDDSQDGADHVDAHRIPAMVISPFARRGAVVHNRYDLLSVTRSIELILGMKALSINDLLATPMYDVFSPKPANIAPVTAIASKVDLLQRNTAASPLARVSAGLALGETDTVPQWQLDDILWKSVFGADSTAPPPGPGAESGS
jgi:YVTN family beta-propeller protein